MQVISTISEAKRVLRALKREGKTIGLVPTMGYLHEGHASLIERAVAQNDVAVVSVFLNPTQFAEGEDLDAYPRDFEADCALCERLGATYVFHPEPSEMYHDAHAFVNIDYLSSTLEGAARPIHFRGVCTVVSKLFNIVQPDRAYFGQKDAQQLAIIRKMVDDLNFDVQVVGCPIVRESDGLAKSSRNTYLSAEDRKAATVLSRSVFRGQEIAHDGMPANELVGEMLHVLAEEPRANVEYVCVNDALDMQPLDALDTEALVSMAVRIGSTRLIDNFVYQPAK